MRLNVLLPATALIVLAVAGCAGTPPPGEQASTHQSAKCERATGSMFCGNGDDQPYGSLNAPSSSTPRSNLSQGATSSGH